MRAMDFLPLTERHEDILAVFARYRDDPSIFVSFTEIKMIGIFPASGFETPIGIYTYPLKEMPELAYEGKFPYPDDPEWVHILRAKPGTRFLNLNTYDQGQYDRDLETLREQHEKRLGANWESFVNACRKEAKKHSPAGYIWNITRIISALESGARGGKSKASAVWNGVLRDLGYDAVADYGLGIIHPNEPTQAVFLKRTAFDHLEMRPYVRKQEIPSGPIPIGSFHDLAGYINQTKGKMLSYYAIKEWDTLLRNGVSEHFKLTKALSQFDNFYGFCHGLLMKGGYAIQFPKLVSAFLRYESLSATKTRFLQALIGGMLTPGDVLSKSKNDFLVYASAMLTEDMAAAIHKNLGDSFGNPKSVIVYTVIKAAFEMSGYISHTPSRIYAGHLLKSIRDILLPFIPEDNYSWLPNRMSVEEFRKIIDAT